MSYPIPHLRDGEIHFAELEVERSRFIAWVCHAPDIARFEALLTRARATYPDASHHCSAFIVGPPGEQTAIGFSDDGEPGGTAGRPMYQVLAGAGIGQIGCVVTRYFGGTKLGTGGLARAYKKAASQALEGLPLEEYIARQPVTLRVDFANEAEARAWLAQRHVIVAGVDYRPDGVVLTLDWPQATLTEFDAFARRLGA